MILIMDCGFSRPKSKYIRITKDDFFTNEEHYLSNTPAKAEKACSYDLDDCDIAWLQILNGERACMGEYAGTMFYILIRSLNQLNR
jgi:hypothetical protein